MFYRFARNGVRRLGCVREKTARRRLCCLVDQFRGVTKMICVQRGLRYPSISCSNLLAAQAAQATCHGVRRDIAIGQQRDAIGVRRASAIDAAGSRRPMRHRACRGPRIASHSLRSDHSMRSGSRAPILMARAVTETFPTPQGCRQSPMLRACTIDGRRADQGAMGPGCHVSLSSRSSRAPGARILQRPRLQMARLTCPVNV